MFNNIGSKLGRVRVLALTRSHNLIDVCRPALFVTRNYSDSIHTNLERKSEIIIPAVPVNPVLSKSEENKANEEKAIKATKLGALVNIGLAASKGVIGYGVGSAGLIADAVNSAGDIITDTIVYLTVRLSRSGVSEKRPWGQGKLEPLGTLCVGAILLMTGFGLGHNSLTVAIDIADAVRNVTAVSSELVASGAADAELGVAAGTLVAPTSGPSWVVFGLECTPWNLSALGVSVGAMAAKEFLFRYTLRAGEAARSSVVITNAWQHRADVGVSMAVFTGVLGGMAGYPLLDPLAGLLVSGMIAKQGIHAVVESVQELSDISATGEELDALRATCRGIGGVKQVVSLTARKSGPFLFVEVTIGVAGIMSASAAHRLAELVRHQVLSEYEGRVVECLVHVDPLGATGLGDKAPLSTRDFDSISAAIHRALLTPAEPEAAGSGPEEEDAETDPLGSLVRLGERRLGVLCADTSPAAQNAFLRRHLSFYIRGISEIQLYYLDSGFIGIKLDVYMHPRVSISEAHTLAVVTRRYVKDVLPGVAEVDVDLELDSVVGDDRQRRLGLAAAEAITGLGGHENTPTSQHRAKTSAGGDGIKKRWTPDPDAQ